MKLFTPVKIGRVEIPNRLVKSAMAEGRCDSGGKPLESLYSLYSSWAKGGTGLLITGMAHVRKDHGFTGHEIGIYADDMIPELRRLTDTVHREASKIFLQISYAPPQVKRSTLKKIGAFGPSTRLSQTSFLIDRKLDEEQIQSIIDDMAKGAKRAQEAGFDGVQFHCAHGYLITQFLSPHYNKRTDRWGGSLENRVRFLQEIVTKSKQLTGDGFPITVKLNAVDGVADGTTLSESLKVASLLEASGVAAIEVSAGIGEVGAGFYPSKGEIPWDMSKKFLSQELPKAALPFMPIVKMILKKQAKLVHFTPDYHVRYAEEFAKRVSIPVMAVGGIRTLESAERILDQTGVKFISLARPLVAEHDLPNKWRNGAASRALCTSCNRCFLGIGLGGELVCQRGRVNSSSL